MKIAIFANDGKQSQNVKQRLEKRFTERHFVLDDKEPDVVISIGGDGTLLSAFHHYENRLDKIRFVGVHTGHLGFYTDWRDEEVDDLELIAVITAAIAASENTSTDGLVVRSIRKVNSRRK